MQGEAYGKGDFKQRLEGSMEGFHEDISEKSVPGREKRRAKA